MLHHAFKRGRLPRLIVVAASSAVLANPCLVTGIPAFATTARDSYSNKRIGGGGAYRKGLGAALFTKSPKLVQTSGGTKPLKTIDKPGYEKHERQSANLGIEGRN